MLYERLARPLLFRSDPEEAHERVSALLAAAGRSALGRGLVGLLAGRPVEGLETEAFGLRFPNPIGLAAGFDKDGLLAPALPALGFGFIEVGSVTLRPQPGNPKPRLFRYPAHEAVVNRMGFNSLGADHAAAALARARPALTVPLGVNLGLNKETPKEAAAEEYARTFSMLEPYGDYFVVNVSSPNTAGLRDLQERLHLEKVLLALRAANANKKPLLVKIAPDLSDEQLPDLLSLIESHAAGVVVSNTTITRPGFEGEAVESPGGLSGRPLRDMSTALLAKVRRLTGGRLPIIGVGGVFTGGDALEKLAAGACLVQLYTSLIYRGPGAARKIQRELKTAMETVGIARVSDAVGRDE